MSNNLSEIYRNRYVTGSSLRLLAVTFYAAFSVLIFPIIVGLGIASFVINALIFADWTQEMERSSLAFFLGGYGILGLIAFAMIFYGIKTLIIIWRKFLRLSASRQYFSFGQSLAMVEGYPKFTGLNEGEIMKYHVEDCTFILTDCSPAGIEPLLANHKSVRVWYVPTANVLVKVEKLRIN